MTAPEATGSARAIRLRIGSVLAAAAAAVAAACVSTKPGVSPVGTPSRLHADPPRVRAARHNQEDALRRLFARARVELPARLLIVAFKAERRLELWGFSHRQRRFVPVAIFPWLATSGRLGPKRRSWDHQIPEGFYRVAGLNPASLYHLSLQVDYPSASDLLLGDRRDPGGDIFIHGDHVSDGCIAIGDRAIEQLYLAVLDSLARGYEVPVEIYPCRFSDRTCRALLRREAEGRRDLAAFWENLAEGFALFRRSGLPPRHWVSRSGRYVFSQSVMAEISASHPTPPAKPR